MFEKFPNNSRYHRVETAQLEAPDGKIIVYLRRRFVPLPGKFATLQIHTVRQGERLDHIAAHYLGDPEQFWRIADANNALHPDDLIKVEHKLRITLPEGVPGVPHA